MLNTRSKVAKHSGTTNREENTTVIGESWTVKSWTVKSWTGKVGLKAEVGKVGLVKVG